jgi:hypothetical protein
MFGFAVTRWFAAGRRAGLIWLANFGAFSVPATWLSLVYDFVAWFKLAANASDLEGDAVFFAPAAAEALDALCAVLRLRRKSFLESEDSKQ